MANGAPSSSYAGGFVTNTQEELSSKAQLISQNHGTALPGVTPRAEANWQNSQNFSVKSSYFQPGRSELRTVSKVRRVIAGGFRKKLRHLVVAF